MFVRSEYAASTEDRSVVFARTFMVKPENSDHVKFIDAEDMRVLYDKLG